MSNEELKAAALAATPGPWILADDSWSDGDNANVSTEERYDGRIISIAQIEGGGSESGFDEPFSAEQQANARYITAANPAVVLALLAELEAKDKRIAELEADKRQLNEIINTEANRADAAETRLATPVGFYTTVSGRGGVVWHNGTPEDDTAIYTAPPAPAVPTFEEWLLTQENKPLGWVRDSMKESYDACRAAMLAQPVSQGCKLPDNVREALTLALQAMEFMGDTLNNIDAVCTEDVEYVTPAFTAVRGLLAAAPEGGSDPDTRR